jgi:hypothetical protein
MNAAGRATQADSTELGWGELLPRTVVLRELPDVILVRPVLALTAYLREELHWSLEHAAELLRTFLARPGTAGARYFQTSALEGWRGVDEPATLARALRSNRGPRHLFRLQVADRADVPTVGFCYREVKPGLSERCGYVQLVLPLETPPDEWVALTQEVVQRYPVVCAVAGPTALWNERIALSGWRGAFRLCRRFVGLDLQAPDEASRVARTGLPSIGWLTFVGEGMLEALDVEPAALSSGLPAGVTVTATPSGLLFRAGATPELGDLNAMENPRTLQALHRHLSGLLVSEGLEFPVHFTEKAADLDEKPAAHTKAWRERLLHPEKWS